MSKDLKQSSLPMTITLPALLLLADGVLALIGITVYRNHAPDRLYDGIGALVIVGTSISILLNKQVSIALSFVCALLLTVDQIRSVISLTSKATRAYVSEHVIVNVVLYWVLFLLYRRWRAAQLAD